LLIIIAHKESFIFEDYFYLIKSDFRLVYDMFSTIISRALIQQHQQDVETCVSVLQHTLNPHYFLKKMCETGKKNKGDVKFKNN
jgi:hypothetical protein